MQTGATVMPPRVQRVTTPTPPRAALFPLSSIHTASAVGGVSGSGSAASAVVAPLSVVSPASVSGAGPFTTSSTPPHHHATTPPPPLIPMPITVKTPHGALVLPMVPPPSSFLGAPPRLPATNTLPIPPPLPLTNGTPLPPPPLTVPVSLSASLPLPPLPVVTIDPPVPARAASKSSKGPKTTPTAAAAASAAAGVSAPASSPPASHEPVTVTGPVGTWILRITDASQYDLPTLRGKKAVQWPVLLVFRVGGPGPPFGGGGGADAALIVPNKASSAGGGSGSGSSGAGTATGLSSMLSMDTDDSDSLLSRISSSVNTSATSDMIPGIRADNDFSFEEKMYSDAAAANGGSSRIGYWFSFARNELLSKPLLQGGDNLPRNEHRIPTKRPVVLFAKGSDGSAPKGIGAYGCCVRPRPPISLVVSTASFECRFTNFATVPAVSPSGGGGGGGGDSKEKVSLAPLAAFIQAHQPINDENFQFSACKNKSVQDKGANLSYIYRKRGDKCDTIFLFTDEQKLALEQLIDSDGLFMDMYEESSSHGERRITRLIGSKRYRSAVITASNKHDLEGLPPTGYTYKWEAAPASMKLDAVLNSHDARAESITENTRFAHKKDSGRHGKPHTKSHKTGKPKEPLPPGAPPPKRIRNKPANGKQSSAAVAASALVELTPTHKKAAKLKRSSSGGGGGGGGGESDEDDRSDNDDTAMGDDMSDDENGYDATQSATSLGSNGSSSGGAASRKRRHANSDEFKPEKKPIFNGARTAAPLTVPILPGTGFALPPIAGGGGLNAIGAGAGAGAAPPPFNDLYDGVLAAANVPIDPTSNMPLPLISNEPVTYQLKPEIREAANLLIASVNQLLSGDFFTAFNTDINRVTEAYDLLKFRLTGAVPDPRAKPLAPNLLASDIPLPPSLPTAQSTVTGLPMPVALPTELQNQLSSRASPSRIPPSSPIPPLSPAPAQHHDIMRPVAVAGAGPVIGGGGGGGGLNDVLPSLPNASHPLLQPRFNPAPSLSGALPPLPGASNVAVAAGGSTSFSAAGPPLTSPRSDDLKELVQHQLFFSDEAVGESGELSSLVPPLTPIPVASLDSIQIDPLPSNAAVAAAASAASTTNNPVNTVNPTGPTNPTFNEAFHALATVGSVNEQQRSYIRNLPRLARAPEGSDSDSEVGRTLNSLGVGLTQRLSTNPIAFGARNSYTPLASGVTGGGLSLPAIGGGTGSGSVSAPFAGPGFVPAPLAIAAPSTPTPPWDWAPAVSPTQLLIRPQQPQSYSAFGVPVPNQTAAQAVGSSPLSSGNFPYSG